MNKINVLLVSKVAILPRMKMVYKFERATQALAYYHHKNPARARSFNLLEPEQGNAPEVSHFSGDHPHDIWAKVCKAIQSTLNEFRGRNEGIAFYAYFIQETKISKETVAKGLNFRTDNEGIASSIRRVNRLLETVMSVFETELAVRGLMAPRENEVN